MDKLFKCIWITNTVADTGNNGITLKELNEKWTKDRENDPIPERTFHNYRQYIADVFGIDIECDKSCNAYFIPEEERSEMLGNDLKMWILHSFAMSNRLSRDLNLRRRVQFENTPGDIRFLEPVMEAMDKNHKIEMQYRKSYWTSQNTSYKCAPLALKLFKQRWYVIALNEDNQTRCFALDSIDTVNITEDSFKMPDDFDLGKYFHDAFGIYVEPDLQTEEIVIESDIDQGNYLKGLPLHHSQKIVEETQDHVVFSWRLKPSYDFKQQLLTMNSHIRVLQPESLKQEMKALINDMAKKYE